LNFIIDAQLPPGLARWIESDERHQAQHVFEIGLNSAADPIIWQRALTDHLVIVSKDEDFVDQFLLSSNPPQLVWIRKGNCSNRSLLQWLETLWPETLSRLEAGEKLIELRA
jgi:predicted nuclease of predicted toxin-antitoxin system